MLLGAALHLIVPAKFTAVTKLFLAEPTTQAMSDDIGLLQTRNVAERADATLHSGGGSELNPSSYKGSAISPSILEIQLRAASPAQAVAKSNALAPAFLAVRSEVLNQQTQVLVTQMQAQITALKNEIQQLSGQIDASPVNPVGSQATHVADLRTQRSNDTGQLIQLQTQVQTALNTEASVNQGSRILDPPAYVAASKKKVVIKDGISGLIAGLAFGLMLAILGELLSDRVRRRADVAAALATPVELSVGHLPRPRWLAGPRMRHALKHPSAPLRLVQHRLRDHLDSTPIAGLSLVEIGAAKPAALALTLLARSLASEGKRVILFDAAYGRPLATLLGKRGGSDRPGAVGTDEPGVALFVAPEDPAQIAWMDCPEDADVLLTLATVDPAMGAEHISTSVSDVIVMVRAGAASAVHIDAIGQLLRQALIGVRSTVLINADPDDHSSGLPARYGAGEDYLDRPPNTIKAGHL
jgi:hypothetical protein